MDLPLEPLFLPENVFMIKSHKYATSLYTPWKHSRLLHEVRPAGVGLGLSPIFKDTLDVMAKMFLLLDL